MVSPYWDPVTGGGERVLKRSALAMRDRGHHVDILTLNTDARMRALWRREELAWEGLRVVKWPARNLVPATQHGFDRLVQKAQNHVFPWNYVSKFWYAPGFAAPGARLRHRPAAQRHRGRVSCGCCATSRRRASCGATRSTSPTSCTTGSTG
jgi:hypothetical protein